MPVFEPFAKSWKSVRGLIAGRRQTAVHAHGRNRRGRRLALEALETRLALSFVLGTTSLTEGPASGSASAIVVGSGNWTATANASWLHTTASGSNNGLATFTFDADSGAIRTGTLTIAGATLSVTQAGRGYVAANPLTRVAPLGQDYPSDVAVDGAGNVYISGLFFINSEPNIQSTNTIEKWDPTTQTLSTVISTGLNNPEGIAVDSAGNLYIADQGDNSIKVWNALTNSLSPLVSTDLNNPQGVAVDSAGNVYIADTGDSVIREWNASTHAVSTPVPSGLSGPAGVAVDAAGNVFIADTHDYAIKEWNAAAGLTTLVGSGLSLPEAVAVDGSGNVYIGDQGEGGGLKEWSASTHAVTILGDPGGTPNGVALDAQGNIFVADINVQALLEAPLAFVPIAPQNENAAAGSGTLSLLPATASLEGGLAPKSNQSWLTVGSASGGAVSFSFTQNTSGVARTAQLTVLRQSITVTQQPALASSGLLEGPAAGGDSEIVSFSGAGRRRLMIPGCIPPRAAQALAWPRSRLTRTPDRRAPARSRSPERPWP